MDHKATRIEAIGVALYGEAGWKARLADALGMTRQHIGAIASGDRRVTPDVEGRIVRWLVDDIIPSTQRLAPQLAHHAAAMARELQLELDGARIPQYRIDYGPLWDTAFMAASRISDEPYDVDALAEKLVDKARTMIADGKRLGRAEGGVDIIVVEDDRHAGDYRVRFYWSPEFASQKLQALMELRTPGSVDGLGEKRMAYVREQEHLAGCRHRDAGLEVI